MPQTNMTPEEIQIANELAARITEFLNRMIGMWKFLVRFIPAAFAGRGYFAIVSTGAKMFESFAWCNDAWLVETMIRVATETDTLHMLRYKINSLPDEPATPSIDLN